MPNAAEAEVDALLQLADGVLLTGSPSNVHPRHFDEAVHNPALPLDPDRDDWTLPFIPRVLARGLPLFAICRGTQETNVALGGSLHQAVQEVDGHIDHRAPSDEDAELQYGPAHEVEVVPGGVLAGIVERPSFEVNSVHGQAVNRLARGLRVEARAPDGLVEAFPFPKPRASISACSGTPNGRPAATRCRCSWRGLRPGLQGLPAAEPTQQVIPWHDETT